MEEIDPKRYLIIRYSTPSGQLVDYWFERNSPMYHMLRDILSRKNIPEDAMRKAIGESDSYTPTLLFNDFDYGQHEELTDLLLEDGVSLAEIGERRINRSKIKMYEVLNPYSKKKAKGKIIERDELRFLLQRLNRPSPGYATHKLEIMVRSGCIEPETEAATRH